MLVSREHSLSEVGGITWKLAKESFSANHSVVQNVWADLVHRDVVDYVLSHFDATAVDFLRKPVSQVYSALQVRKHFNYAN